MSHTITTLPVSTLANGHQYELYVHELRGSGDGPVLGLLAGVHGDEPLGIEIVRRIVAETDTSRLRGAILAMPVANAYGFEALTRNVPLDMTNLNRIVPGDPNGMFTDQLAHVICDRFIRRCTHFVDLHSGGNLATVDYSYLFENGADLSKVYGCELLYRGPGYVGTTTGFAQSLGIPALVSELGGGQQGNEHFIQKGVRGLRNILRHLGMIEGQPEPRPKQTLITELLVVRPHHGGLLYPEVTLDQLGTSVPKGTLLGRTRSPYTFDELEVFPAPFEPSILVLVRDQLTRVNPGDYAFMVANGATAEPVE